MESKPEQRAHTEPRARPPGRWIAIFAVALTAGAIWVLWGRGVPGSAELRRALADRGKVAVVGEGDLLRIKARGTELVPADEIDGLVQALAGTDEGALARVVDRAGVRGLLLDTRGARAERPRSLGERLLSYAHVDAFLGAYLSPTSALYERAEDLRLAPPFDEAVAKVARSLLEGARAPRIQSFPEPLRRLRNVEVLVMLRDRGRPRLWRSARGGSIARALVTAAVVARNRWIERQGAMGGPIIDALKHIDVEVYALAEDGTLDARTPAFIERVFSSREHGVAYERNGTWRYLLPEATRTTGGGSAMSAYSALFQEYGLPAESVGRPDIRLYRLVAIPLGASRIEGVQAPSPSPPPPPSVPAP